MQTHNNYSQEAYLYGLPVCISLFVHLFIHLFQHHFDFRYLQDGYTEIKKTSHDDEEAMPMKPLNVSPNHL